jgi:hypothetical protein
VHGAAVGNTTPQQQSAAAAAGSEQTAANAGQQQTPGVVLFTAELVQEIEQLQEQLRKLNSDASTSDTVIDSLREVAAQLAAAHSKLHLWAVTAKGVHGQEAWRKELAEYQCLDHEDAMEAAYLLIQQQQYRLAGAHTLTLGQTVEHVTNHLLCQLGGLRRAPTIIPFVMHGDWPIPASCAADDASWCAQMLCNGAHRMCCLCHLLMSCAGRGLSAKERKNVFGRISDHRERIKQLVQKYNCIRSQGVIARTAASEESVAAGDFPWAFRHLQADTTGGDCRSAQCAAARFDCLKLTWWPFTSCEARA